MQSTNARTRLTRCMAVTTRLRRSPHPPRGWRIQVTGYSVDSYMGGAPYSVGRSGGGGLGAGNSSGTSGAG